VSELARSRFLLAAWCVALFAFSFALNSRHQQFPYYYHPDEPGKVEQILTGEWNLHHPLLLLQATKLGVALAGTERAEQPIVEAGRAVSALFIAGAIVALSLLAFCWRGWGAAIATGAVFAWHHQLYELSHYLKEDSALLFGIALACLTAWLYAERPSSQRAAFLGLACGLAISGKYLGIVTLGIALPVLWRASRTRFSAAFVIALLATVILVNLPVFAHLDTFRSSFSRETALVVKGQSGMTRNLPHSESWSAFLDNATPAMWPLLLIFFYARSRQRRSINAAEIVLTLFPVAFALVLSFSPKSNDRYFLPASALFALFAVIGASDLARLLSPRFPRPLVFGVAAVALVAAQFPSWSASRGGWLAYERAFQTDDNADLIAWLNSNVPPGAVIAKDNRVALPDPRRKKHAARLGIIPQKVITPTWEGKRTNFAADLGPLEKMRAEGITHVAVSEMDYGKFFRASLRPQDSDRANFERRRAFYERLFREAELLWHRDKSLVLYLHPGIRVYRLR